MRDKDDFGFDLSWADRHIDREVVNQYAHFDSNEAEQGTWDNKFLNQPFPVAKLGGYLRYLDTWQSANDPSGCNYTFLEVGCGPGIKAILASSMFNYRAEGFDIRGEMVTTARETAAMLEDDAYFFQGDALTCDEYGRFDVVFLNRLFVGLAQQTELEQKVLRDMHPGAFLILVNGVSPVYENVRLIHTEPGARIMIKDVDNPPFAG